MKKLLLILPILFWFPSVTHAALTTNLVSYYKLDESSGNAADSVSTNTLTNTGTVYNAGLINNGSDYGSTDAHSNCLSRTDGLGIDMSGAYSVSFWVKMTASSAGNRIFDWRSTTGTARYLLIDYNTGTSALNIIASNAGNAYTIALGTTNYHHIVVTVSAASAGNLYVDGSAVMTFTRGTGTAGNSLDLGNNSSCSVGGAPSKIDEAGFWSRELTASEVTQLYNSGAGLQYPFTVAAPLFNLWQFFTF